MTTSDENPEPGPGEPEPFGAWSPEPVVVGVAWVLAAGMLAWTLLGTRPTGQVLTGIATVGLLLFAVFGTVARPRLTAGPDGVTVRRLFGRRHWPWARVRFTVTSTRRFGRDVSMLELDGTDEEGTETLIVLGRLDLGTDPVDVAARLRAHQP